MLESWARPYEVPPRAAAFGRGARVNPSGKDPAAAGRGPAICDSTAIVTISPTSTASSRIRRVRVARARQDAMTFRVLDEVDSVLWAGAKHSFVLPEEAAGCRSSRTA